VVLTHVAGDVVLEFGRIRALGLRHVEDVHSGEPINTGAGLVSPFMFGSSSVVSFLRRCPTIGARIWMPFSPRFTNRPNWRLLTPI
jgi:hypothetical protein